MWFTLMNTPLILIFNNTIKRKIPEYYIDSCYSCGNTHKTSFYVDGMSPCLNCFGLSVIIDLNKELN